MTPEENQALQQLLSQLTQIRGIDKDPEADRMIAHAVARQPDAAYLLIQRTMILEQALNAAKEQISQLQSQNQPATPAAAGRSFLDANAWGNHASSSAPAQRPLETSVTGRPLNQAGHPQWSGNNMGVQPGMGAMPGRRSSFLGGGGSMLGTMAATAAGVAGGAFLFHGIGNLLDNRNQGDSQSLADNTPAAEAGGGNQLDGNELNNMETAGSQDLASADDPGGATNDSLLSDSSGLDGGSFDSDSYEV